MFEVIKTSEIPINKQPGKLTVTFHCIEIHGRFGMQQGVRLLEVEPAETEMAIRRIHYYERNGYRILDRNYLQPPYVKGGKDFPLWVMGNGSGQSAEVLNRQIQTIKDKVYYRL